MPHPAFYAVTIGAAIAFVAGFTIYNYFASQNTYKSRREPTYNYNYDFLDCDSQCTICLDGVENAQCRYLQCGHVFHHNCIAQWLRRNNTCPNCKKII